MSALLDNHLAILKPYLSRKDIVEVSINKPGEVWLETEHKGWQCRKDSKLTLSRLLHLAKVLATEAGQEFSDEVPMLSLSLPKYGYRLQVVSGSAVDSKFSLSIRVSAALDIPLSSWFSAEEEAYIKTLIAKRSTMLISGGTGSGKTTLLNALLREIDAKDRIITLEDSRELIVRQPNHVRLIKSKTGTDVASLSYKDFINAIVRLRPDRILLGEIDVENTANFLRLINTGHDGSFATIHANSTEAAIDALVQNCELGGFKGSAESIRRYALQHINYIIQVRRTAKRTFSAEIRKIGAQADSAEKRSPQMACSA